MKRKRVKSEERMDSKGRNVEIAANRKRRKRNIRNIWSLFSFSFFLLMKSSFFLEQEKGEQRETWKWKEDKKEDKG